MVMECWFRADGYRMASLVVAQPYPFSKSETTSFLGYDLHRHCEISTSWGRKEGKFVNDVSGPSCGIVRTMLIIIQTLRGYWDDLLRGCLRYWRRVL